MSYVIYEVDTTLLATTKEYKTYPAAKAALTRYLNKIHKETGHIGTDIDYAIADSVAFYTKIEKKVPRENLMSGTTFYEGVNTPIYCSPASESYWSA